MVELLRSFCFPFSSLGGGSQLRGLQCCENADQAPSSLHLLQCSGKFITCYFICSPRHLSFKFITLTAFKHRCCSHFIGACEVFDLNVSILGSLWGTARDSCIWLSLKPDKEIRGSVFLLIIQTYAHRGHTIPCSIFTKPCSISFF